MTGDTETGWYYLQSRYYDPTTCRFISADVLLSTGQGVLGHNAYTYCLNNPVNFIDEGGCRPKSYSTMMTDSGGFCGTYGGGAVTLTVTGNKVIISATLAVSGNGQYDEQYVEAALKKYYEGSYTEGSWTYDVVLDLTFVPYTDYNEEAGVWPGNVIQFDIRNGAGISYAHGYQIGNRWKDDKSGTIVAYTHWGDGSLKDDFDWTLAHEFAHCLNIGDQGAGEAALFGGEYTIMNTRNIGMSSGVMRMIINAFVSNRGFGW